MSTTKTTSPHEEAERLANAAAKAVAEANAAQARADEARRLAEERRLAEVAALRLRRLDAFDEAALDAEVKAARSRFAEAVRAGDTGLLEFVAWRVARTQRYVLAVDAETARAAVAHDRPSIVTGSPAEMVYAAELQRILDGMVADKVEAMAAELQAELDSAGR